MFKLLRKMKAGSSGVQSPPIVPQSEPLNPGGIELQDNGSAV